jgi:hypothetical protein
MPPLEQITIAPRLTFDALAAGKPGAPLRLHDAVAVVRAGGPDDRRFPAGAAALVGRSPCRRHRMVS